MAKKVRRVEATTTRSLAKGTGRKILFMIYAGVALLGMGGIYWRTGTKELVTAQRLPPEPNLAVKPPGLADALGAARQQTLAGGTKAIQGLEKLGKLYHVNGFETEAAACWNLLRSIQPREGRWCYYLADLRRAAVDESGLKFFLEETVHLTPGYAPAWLKLGELEFKSGHLEAAAQAYSRRLALVPKDPYARFGLVRIAVQRGELERSRAELEELLQETPEFSSGHNFYAGLLAQRGDEQRASRERWLGTVAERFRSATDPWLEEMRTDCFDVDQLTVWADIDAQTKFGDRGRALFERAFQVAPNDQRACANLGRHYLNANEPAKAIDVLEKGIRTPGQSERLYICLSEAYQRSNRLGEALRTAERAVALTPDSAAVHVSYASLLEAANRPDEAIDAYRAAMIRSPNMADPIAKLGLLLSRLGRRDEGYVYLTKAVEIQPGFPIAVTILGALEIDAGHLDAAARYIMPYFQQYPGLPEACELVSKLYLARAGVAVEKRDAAEVERLCREGLEWVPDSAELNGYIGAFYLQLRQLSEALNFLEKSYRLQPGDVRVSWLLGDLYLQLGRNDDARRFWRYTEATARQSGDALLVARCKERLEQTPK